MKRYLPDIFKLRANKFISVAICFFFSVAFSNAQINKANAYFIEKNYEKAILHYQKDSVSTSKDGEALYNLSLAHAQLNQYENAIHSFLLAEKLEIPSREQQLKATKWLMLNGQFKEAQARILRQTKDIGDSSDWFDLNKNLDSLVVWKEQGSEAQTELLKSINSAENDYSPVFNGGMIYFVSDRVETGDGDIFENRKAHPEIWISEVKNNEFSKPKKIFNTLNDQFADGSFTFSADGKIIYFTRSSVGKTNKNQLNKLQLFKAELVDGKWKNIQKLSFNDSNYNFAHPALNKDGNTIFFSSDKSGSFGGMDLWMSKWDGASWGEVIHLPSSVNTTKNELFPTIFQDTLFFSTDGLIGYGGMDIFKMPLSNMAGNAINLKAPINSGVDDFGINFTSASRGYFTSNRSGGSGKDDVFAFEFKQTENIKPISYVGSIDTIALKESLLKIDLFGQVYNQERGDIEAGLLIYLLNDKGKIIAETFTNAAGNFNFRNLFPDDQYLFRIRSDNPNLKIIMVNQKGELIQKLIRLNDGDFVYMRLNPDDELITILNEEDVQIKIKPQENFLIPNIYYELNSFAINSSAEIELNKLVEIIKKNPHIVVQLFSHTDSRSSAAYNLELSIKRVQSAIDYLESKGVDPSCISGKGVGEVELLNQCTDNVYCTEEEHAVNRRTEFKINRK